MQLGRFDLTTISGGTFNIDGGTMFGVVPKVLWSKVFPCDEKNNIPQETNCVLVRDEDRNILIDTGYGSKFTEKKRNIFESQEGDPLAENLQAAGLSVEDIDVVILSHLHFDHAGGATRQNEDGTLSPTFPNAEYVAQRLEWVTATAGFPELRGAYPQDNLFPLKDSGQLRLVDGNVELLPGIRAVVTGGHTKGHSAIVIESDDETAVYLGDLCPTTRHLPSLWGMAYDVDTLELRRNKPQLLGQIVENNWWALFDHDPDHAAAKLLRDPRRDFAISDALKKI